MPQLGILGPENGASCKRVGFGQLSIAFDSKKGSKRPNFQQLSEAYLVNGYPCSFFTPRQGMADTLVHKAPRGAVIVQ